MTMQQALSCAMRAAFIGTPTASTGGLEPVRLAVHSTVLLG